jgi:hypothetical protein
MNYCYAIWLNMNIELKVACGVRCTTQHKYCNSQPHLVDWAWMFEDRNKKEVKSSQSLASRKGIMRYTRE